MGPYLPPPVGIPRTYLLGASEIHQGCIGLRQFGLAAGHLDRPAAPAKKRAAGVSEGGSLVASCRTLARMDVSPAGLKATSKRRTAISPRSELFRWMVEDHDRIVAASVLDARQSADGRRPHRGSIPWAALCDDLHAAGLTDGNGNRATAETASATWARARKVVAMARAIGTPCPSESPRLGGAGQIEAALAPHSMRPEIKSAPAGLETVLNCVMQRPRHSALFYWMLEHHDRLIDAWSGKHVRWAAACAQFAIMGLTDIKGNPPSVPVARHTWTNVCWSVRSGRDAAGPVSGSSGTGPQS